MIIDGRKLSEEILLKLKRKAKGLNLKLAIVLVGENKASELFTKKKGEACRKIGIDFELFKFSSKVKKERLKKEVLEIAKNPKISGLVIQLPLPKGIKEGEMLNLIPFKKDVDVLSEKSLKKFSQGDFEILPPTVGAVSFLLKKFKIKIKGKNVVLVGAGKLVGKPLSIWFLKNKANVIVVDKSVKSISLFTKKADILISGTGKPNLIKGDMVKKGVFVLDFGSGSPAVASLRRMRAGILKGKIRGDIDFKSVSKKASYISPVPGGVGPLTIAMVLENLVKLSNKKDKR